MEELGALMRPGKAFLTISLPFSLENSIMSYELVTLHCT
jgi:hypothetical protein